MALAKCLASPYLTLSRRQSVRPPFAFENHFHVEVPDRFLCLGSANSQVLQKQVQKRRRGAENIMRQSGVVPNSDPRQIITPLVLVGLGLGMED